MKNLKPLTRNKNLVSLSHDHYGGLLFARRIKQGIENSTDLLLIKEYIKNFWVSALESHFEEEEKFLFSKLNRKDEKRQQAEEEHLYIRSLIVNILIKKTQSAPLMEEFSSALTNHIRFEERELFPHIESLLDASVLVEIGNEIGKQESGPKWENEFWGNQPPLK